MCALLDGSLTQRLAPVLGAIRATATRSQFHEDAAAATPFVTISREAGADEVGVGDRLAERLNACAPDGPAWTCWDRELVEKVAADHHLSKRLIEEIEETKPSWLGELLVGISSAPGQDPFLVYHRVATTMMALAQAGRVVLVGRGAVFVTRRLPGGVHVRLIAPFEHRAKEIARRIKLSAEEAASYVRRADDARAAFYRTHWPGTSLQPESFTITLNTAAIAPEKLVECILPLVGAAAHAREPAAQA